MIKKFKWWILACSCLSLLVFWGRESLAEGVGFTVNTFKNEHQIGEEGGNFNLRLLPNQETTLVFQIHNSTTQKALFEAAVHSAFTNSNAVIDYTGTKQKKAFTSNLPLKFEEIVGNFEHKVEVLPEANAQVKIPLKMPAKKFDGMILGGFYLKKKNEGGSGTDYVFSYVSPIAITQSDTPIKRELKCTGTKLMAKNWNVFLTPSFENPTATVLNSVRISLSVKDKSNKVVTKKVIPQGQVAPNSRFALPIRYSNKKFPPGKYVLSGDAKDKKGHVFKFHNTFTVTKSESREVEEAATFRVKKRYGMYIALGVCIVVIIGLLIVILRLKKS